jgi:hypothetical protein
MSQPTEWGVPRTDGGNEYTPEQFAERADESFDALLSLHKGNSRPAYAEAGTLWLDDSATPWRLKVFDGSDDITIGTVNPSDNKFTPDRAVLYEAQTLDSGQKGQARANIAALSYESQSLDSGQKAQARANINAPERIVLDVVAPAGAGVGGAVPLTLINSKAYTIRLNTLGTGTRTGAVYNLWSDSSAWQLKRLSGISESNHPELRLNSNGDGLEVFTQHANSYTIRLHIDVWDTINTNGILESFFAPAVSYVPQTLSPAEQSQARANIGALGPNETADRAFRRGNILGTVSQSGGTPTGAIIERGSNANGEYVRFADGTQICTQSIGPVSLTASGITGAVCMSSSQSVTFPATFSNPPNHLSITATKISGPGIVWGVAESTITASGASGLRAGGSQVDATASLHVMAVGRWF